MRAILNCQECKMSNSEVKCCCNRLEMASENDLARERKKKLKFKPEMEPENKSLAQLLLQLSKKIRDLKKFWSD